MSDSFSDERADMASKTHYVDAHEGLVVPLVRNDMYVKTRDGAGAISITTTPPSSVPIGLRVTFDNSGGSGVLNVNSGEVQVPPGLVYEAKVGGDGAGGHVFVVAGPETPANTLTTLASLQSAIDNDKENGRLLVLQAGETNLTSTLVIDGGSGGGLYGQGKPEPIVQASSNARGGSILVYTGTKASNEAAIESDRTDNVLQDLAVQGETTANLVAGTGTYTPRGYQVIRSVSLGSGKPEMRNVRFSGFGKAIVMGESIGDLNCDEGRFYSMFSHKNTTFFTAMNAQCLGHRFYGLRVNETDTVFDYKGGGKLSVHGCDILSETTLLHLDGTEASGFGQNFSKWTFDTIELDAGARNTRLLTCTDDDFFGSNIIFRGLQLSTNEVGAWDNELINVGENMIVQIDDATNLCAGAIRWNTSSNKSIIHIRNSRVWTDVSAPADLFDTANSTGNLRCIVEMCYQHATYTLLNSGTLYNQVLAGT